MINVLVWSVCVWCMLDGAVQWVLAFVKMARLWFIFEMLCDIFRIVHVKNAFSNGLRFCHDKWPVESIVINLVFMNKILLFHFNKVVIHFRNFHLSINMFSSGWIFSFTFLVHIGVCDSFKLSNLNGYLVIGLTF